MELDQQLTRLEASARAELLHNMGKENILKIWTTSKKSSSMTKYSPDHYHLVRVNNPSSLSILTLTHMEEEVQQVDFMVDLSQPPDPVLVQFLSSNLSRQVKAKQNQNSFVTKIPKTRCNSVMGWRRRSWCWPPLRSARCSSRGKLSVFFVEKNSNVCVPQIGW